MLSPTSVHLRAVLAGALVGVLVAGPASGDQLCDDLAIGASGDRASGTSAGAVNVLPGTLAADGLGSAGDQIWWQSYVVVPGTPTAGDLFGFSLAAGDFDGRNTGDLAVGVPGEEVSSASGAGLVSLIYGNRYGLGASGGQLSQATPGFGCCVPEEDDFMGHAVAVGDLDGDGYDDLAIGAWSEAADPEAEPGFRAPDSGVVHVVRGSASGLDPSTQEVWHQDSPGISDNPDLDDRFGFALAVGDFDHDGILDLVVGAPGEFLNRPPADINNRAGAVHVLYGDGATLNGAGEDFWRQDELLGAGAAEQDEFLGWAVAVGNFDGDPYDDLAIGVPYDNGAGADAGIVHVLYGSGSGLTTTGVQHWVQGLLGDDHGPDHFGKALAAGDFDRDGYDDLIVGAPEETLEDPGGDILRAGAFHLIFGSAAGLTDVAATMFSRQGSLLAGDPQNDGEFGSAFAVGDFDCDGYDDVAVGGPGHSVAGKADAGTVNVIYGSILGLLPVGGGQEWTQATLGVLGSPDVGDRFGESLGVVPELWNIFSDGFESGNANRWAEEVP